jgi:hypothetical protein
MPSEPSDNKNSLQSVVDSIQTQVSSVKTDPAKGYVPNPELKSLRTFQGDVQEHIDVKKETIATIALAEQKKKIENNEPTYTERPKSSSHAGLFIAIGIVCFIGGGIIFGGIYFLNTQKEDDVVLQAEQVIIPYTHKKEVVLDNTSAGALTSALILEKNSFKPEVNNVLYVSFVYGTSSLPVSTILNIIAPRAGDALKRNISEVMTGVYSYDTTEIFFLLRPDDFGIAYSEMLNWESSLGGDMSVFFPELQTHLSTNPSVFTDETYKNKDVRVIRNSSGKIVLLYGFIDRDTLVITANEKIFEAILNKYNQSKLAR